MPVSYTKDDNFDNSMPLAASLCTYYLCTYYLCTSSW
jgi:hypothetical protein